MRHQITIEQFNHMEIDDAGRLYWKGEAVVTEQKLAVSKAVSASIIVTAIATAGMCLVMWFAYFWPPSVS